MSMPADFKNNNTEFDIDLTYLRDVSSGSNEFMIEMIDLFLEQTPGYFDQLEQLIMEANWSNVADIAHKIKPTMSFMGVGSAGEKMSEIEQNARTGKNLDAISPIFNQLKDMSESLYFKLSQIKKELQAAC